ncbi:MAG: hypothetical protein U0T68_10555 [Ferruginibacter sp.]
MKNTFNAKECTGTATSVKSTPDKDVAGTIIQAIINEEKNGSLDFNRPIIV